MREIKFRGKSKCNGEWFFGNYYDRDTKGNTHIVAPTKGCLVINPKTVGQFTGLKDKNGKDIYEGDVIECGLKYYVCEFVEGCFLFRDTKDGEFTLNAIVIYSHIIGNIHDNPELLNNKNKAI